VPAAAVGVAGVPAAALRVAASRVPPAALSWRPAVVAASAAVVGAVAVTRAGGPAPVCDVVGVVAEVEPAVGCGEPAASAEAVAQASVAGAAGRRVGRPTAARAADRQE
jgi:hypothetical protein